MRGSSFDSWARMSERLNMVAHTGWCLHGHVAMHAAHSTCKADCWLKTWYFFLAGVRKGSTDNLI